VSALPARRRIFRSRQGQPHTRGFRARPTRRALASHPHTALPAAHSAIMKQLSPASLRRPRLISIRRALLITAVASAETVIRGVLHRLVFTRDGGSWDLPAHDAKTGRLMRGGIENWQQNHRRHPRRRRHLPRQRPRPGLRVPARRHRRGLDRYLSRQPRICPAASSRLRRERPRRTALAARRDSLPAGRPSRR
jgi:hypothetical protein